MDIQAIAKHIRVSPRKLQLLVKSIKKLRPEDAVVQLGFLNKSGADELKEVIASALNNAKQKNVSQDMTFKAIEILPGGAMKRFRAVSRGMAHEYKKRMSHIKIVLTDEVVKNSKSQIPNTKQYPITKISK